MNCSLSDFQRDGGARCRSWNCVPCREHNNVKKPAVMNFSDALNYLIQADHSLDCKICRSGWNGKGLWVALQRPDHNSKMRKPYLYIKSVDDELVPWVASQTDMLAEDWERV